MYTLSACFFYAGVHFRQAQAKEKAENKQEREEMGTGEEGTDEEKRKHCASGFKIHSSQTKSSILIDYLLSR